MPDQDPPAAKPTVKMAAVRPEQELERTRHEMDLLRADTGVIGERVTHVEKRVGRVETALGRAAPRPPPSPSRAEIAKHRDAAIDAVRQKSDADLEHAATVGGMIAHTRRIELAVAALSEAQRRNDEAQDQALIVIVRELGIESRLPQKLRQSIPPPPDGAAPPLPPVLGRLERRAKSSQIVQFVIALGVVADVIRGLLLHH